MSAHLVSTEGSASPEERRWKLGPGSPGPAAQRPPAVGSQRAGAHWVQVSGKWWARKPHKTSVISPGVAGAPRRGCCGCSSPGAEEVAAGMSLPYRAVSGTSCRLAWRAEGWWGKCIWRHTVCLCWCRRNCTAGAWRGMWHRPRQCCWPGSPYCMRKRHRHCCIALHCASGRVFAWLCRSACLWPPHRMWAQTRMYESHLLWWWWRNGAVDLCYLPVSWKTALWAYTAKKREKE